MAQPDRDDNSPADPPPVRPTEPSDTAQQFQLVMAELRKTRDDMQHKFDTLQEEIAAGQDDATERVVKKLRVDRGYTFKKKGHEHQFRFNAEIEERIVKAQTEAAKIKPASSKEASTGDPPTRAEGRYSIDRIATEAHQGGGQVRVWLGHCRGV